MATLTRRSGADHDRLGPANHGLAMSFEKFVTGKYETGFKYELIDGRLFVSPAPSFSQDRLVNWLNDALTRYRLHHPEILNYQSLRARVFVAERSEPTCPEPDIAAYAEVPLELPSTDVNWEDIHPILVVEVMTGDKWKDMVRNTQLYFQSPSIREYWVIDACDIPDQPTLIQHKRRGNRWVVRKFAFGSTFTTKLLPGFSIVIDPRQ